MEDKGEENNELTKIEENNRRVKLGGMGIERSIPWPHHHTPTLLRLIVFFVLKRYFLCYREKMSKNHQIFFNQLLS